MVVTWIVTTAFFPYRDSCPRFELGLANFFLAVSRAGLPARLALPPGSWNLRRAAAALISSFCVTEQHALSLA